MPDNVDDEGLKEAYEEAAQHNWTREAYDAYIYSGIRDQDDKGRLEKAELYEVEQVFSMDVKAIYQKVADDRNAEKQRQKEEKEKADFERLKSKFG